MVDLESCAQSGDGWFMVCPMRLASPILTDVPRKVDKLCPQFLLRLMLFGQYLVLLSD